MFGGYLGQDEDKKTIKELTLKLKQDPDNKELKKELEAAKKLHNDRLDSALESYMRI